MKALIMAGGTGGHVFPALAVARVLLDHGHEVVWMGTPDSFESRSVPSHGIPMEFVRIAGLRGKGLLCWLSAPWRLARALLDASAVLARQRPQVVLGMGGFAAGPGGLMARLHHVPLVIHEQNAVAGLTNRVLAHIAKVVLQAFPDTFRDARTVGNPVRAGIAELPLPEQRMNRSGGPPQLLVLGGSQGARSLNLRVPEALARLPESLRPQVRHQGGRTVDVANQAYAQHGVHAEINAFIDDMPSAYGWADLVLCRAGASTVAELAAAGCASLLVPYPNAVDDHQTRNADYLVGVGAAELIQERDMDAARLSALLSSLCGDRPQLLKMANAARAVAWPDAAGVIAGICEAAAC